MASAGGLRWLERVAGVALGSLATAWWMRAPDDPPAARSEAAPLQAPTVSAPAATVDAPAASVDAAIDEAPATIVAAPEIEAPEIEAPAIEAPAPTPSEPAAAPNGEAPSLPLPRMPGAARLSDAARFDAHSGTWVLRASYRVHAHAPQVLSFYAKALADEGLAVTDGQDPVRDDGTAISYVYGKNDRVRAQVSVRTQGSELEARIGILWRVRG